MTTADNINAKLDELTICHGVGNTDEHTACTIAAINLAESGRLTDDCPKCVSEVLHRWVIPAQDRVSVETLNSPEWRDLVPRIAGTAEADPEVLRAVLVGAMWEPLGWAQRFADKYGFGAEWGKMLEDRTPEACRQARAVANAANAVAVANAAAVAATVAYAAAYAAYAAAYAAAAGVAWAAADARFDDWAVRTLTAALEAVGA